MNETGDDGETKSDKPDTSAGRAIVDQEAISAKKLDIVRRASLRCGRDGTPQLGLGPLFSVCRMGFASALNTHEYYRKEVSRIMKDTKQRT